MKTDQTKAPEVLGEAMLDKAVGGFNPQPDPPGKVAKIQPGNVLNPNAITARGIIIVGG